MKNKKLLTGLLLTTIVVGWISATFASDSTNSWITNTIKEYWRWFTMTAEQKIEIDAMKVIFDKKKNGETLTTDEQAKLTTFEANRPQRWEWKWFGWKMWERWEWKWIGWKMWGQFMNNLTDAEKTALTTMTDTEKQAFFEKKREENKVKRDAHENVIDKVLAGKTLTSDEETTKQEIIKERADKKAQKVQMEAKMTEIKPILDKKKAWTTLTADEQAKLDAFKASRPEWEWRWKWFGWWHR